MLKCGNCGSENVKRSLKKPETLMRQDLEKVLEVKNRFGYFDKEVKEELADKLNISVRQIEKYNKLLESQGDDPVKTVDFIDEKKSINKAYKSLKTPSEEKELLKHFKALRQKYPELEYKEFVHFLESSRKKGGLFNGAKGFFKSPNPQ